MNPLMLETKLPNKETVRPGELARLFKGIPGFSRPSIYRKIEEGKFETETASDNGILIIRSSIVRYFRSLSLR